MKKQVFLSLAVLLCLACSKSDTLAAPAAASARQASSKVELETVTVAFNNYVSGLANASYVEYTDRYGERQILHPTLLTTYIDVARTGYITVNIFIDAPGGAYQTIYTTVSADTQPAYYRDFTGANPINSFATVSMGSVTGDRVTITLMAGLDDIRPSVE